MILTQTFLWKKGGRVIVLCIYKQNTWVYEALDICTLIHYLFHMKYRMQLYF